MKEKLKIDKYYTLYHWIMLGCIALMIPILCAVINFFINKHLIEQKVKQVNEFMLKNIQYNIDSKLNNILDISKYYLLSQDFSLYSLNVKDEQRFLARVQDGYQSMKSISTANSGIEIMMYIREKDYILGSGTANRIDYIYESLVSQGKLHITLNEWKKQLIQNDKSSFLISDRIGYVHCGEESLVYTTPVLYSNPKDAGYLIVSIPAKFIDTLMSRQMNNTVLILDQNNRVIGQYGAGLHLPDLDMETPLSQGNVSFHMPDGKYAGAYITSEVTNWKYVVCMPERLLMKEIVFHRNINLLIVLIGAVIGMLAVIFSQRRNYQPVQKLMDLLPEQNNEEESPNEFVRVEKNLRRLYDENHVMQDSIKRYREFDRELGLLSIIRGDGNYFRVLSKEELLGDGYQNCQFAFVTIQISLDDCVSTCNKSLDYNLMRFLIDNITTDILEHEFRYIKTIDDGSLVYLFLLENDCMKNWDSLCMDKFTWLNEFFQKRLEYDLSITLGSTFDTIEHVVSAYAAMKESNVQRYYTEPYGIVRADDIGSIDFSSSGSLAYYCKCFEEMAVKGDYEEGRRLSEELFDELEHSGKKYNTMLYYVFSIVNHVLMLSHSMTEDVIVYEEALDRIRRSESISALKHEFFHFLRLICKDVDKDQKESKRLSEHIKTYVQQQYSDCNMNISAIADEIGITPRYMSKMFKEQTGITLLNYINDVRIEHAKFLLKTTTKTVDEISEETGFANSRTFRRNFQKATGVTAMYYKNMATDLEDAHTQ